MPRNNTVPWTDLFPELKGNTEIAMTRDSMRRQNGDRHYRVKLHFPHRRLDEVRRKLEPYGFAVSEWQWICHRNMVPVNGNTPEWRQAIKCVRHSSAG